MMQTGMSESFSSVLLGSLTEFPCPVCGYVVEVEVVDVVCQVRRWCPCCRTAIQLIEAGGEMTGVLAGIDRAVGDLEESIRRAFR